MPAKHALLIGIDEFPNLEDRWQLSGCVNDAKLIKSVLLDHFKFSESEITELHNEGATREGILRQMNRLVDEAGKDDIVVFHFSGHGSRRTTSDPEEASGLDSTIMTYDSGRDPLPNLDIVDDEIHEWLTRLAEKTRYISLIFDCCHSGTITRDAFGATARAVEPDLRPLEDMGIDPARMPRARGGKKRDVGPSGWLEVSSSWVVMSGCRDDEFSYEYNKEDGGVTSKGGALTHFLTQALIRAKPGTTYRDVYELARQGVNTMFPQQNPQIEGAQDREIFGIRDIEPLRFIPIESVDGERVTLGGGAAHGLVTHSLWTVYPQGTKQIRGSEPLGVVEITSVGPLTAEAAIRETKGEIAAGARCVETAPASGEYELRIDLSALDDDSREAFEPRVQASSLLAVAKTPGAADRRVYVLEPRTEASPDSPVPQIERIDAPAWAIVDREGNLAMPLHAIDEDNVIGILVDNLEATSRYRNALMLDNPNSDLDVEFNIYKRKPDGKLEKANGGDAVFEEGDCIAFEVVNNEEAPVFVSVLDFGLTGRISLLYPPNKRSEMIAAGQTLRIGAGDRKIRLGMPKGFAADRGTETFKAFITSDEADFSWLQQQGMRSTDSSRSRLRRQFEAAYQGPKTREATIEPEEGEDQAWDAIGRSFELKRATGGAK